MYINLSVQSIGFKICFLVVLCMGFINSCIWMLPNYGGYTGYIIDKSATFILYFYSPFSEIFQYMSFFLLLLPFCLTNISINETCKNIDKIEDDCAGRVTACFFSTFIAFFIPFLLHLLINQIFFHSTGVLGSGLNIYEYNGAASLSGQNCTDDVLNPGIGLISSKLFVNYPLLYNSLYALIYSLLMALLATNTYAISFFFKRKIYMIIYIFALYYVICHISDILLILFGKAYDTDIISYFLITYNMNLLPCFIVILSIILLLITSYMIKKQIIEIKKESSNLL